MYVLALCCWKMLPLMFDIYLYKCSQNSKVVKTRYMQRL